MGNMKKATYNVTGLISLICPHYGVDIEPGDIWFCDSCEKEFELE